MWSENEKKIWSGSPSLYVTLPYWFVAFMIIALAELLLIPLMAPLDRLLDQESLPWVVRDLISIRLLLVLAVMAVPLWKSLSVLATTYSVTNERIALATGILVRHYEQIELFRMRDLTLRRSILMRVLGLGDIYLFSRDISLPECRLRAVRNPFQVSDILRTHMVEAKRARGLKEFEVT